MTFFYKTYHRAIFSLLPLFEMKANNEMDTPKFKQELITALSDSDMMEMLELNIDEAFTGKYTKEPESV